MNLETIRQEIDLVDSQLVKLLEQRMELVSQVTAYKKTHGKAVLDSQREKEVLKKVANRVVSDDYRATIVATFSDIMAQSRAYQASQLEQSHETLD